MTALSLLNQHFRFMGWIIFALTTTACVYHPGKPDTWQDDQSLGNHCQSIHGRYSIRGVESSWNPICRNVSLLRLPDFLIEDSKLFQRYHQQATHIDINQKADSWVFDIFQGETLLEKVEVDLAQTELQCRDGLYEANRDDADVFFRKSRTQLGQIISDSSLLFSRKSSGNLQMKVWGHAHGAYSGLPYYFNKSCWTEFDQILPVGEEIADGESTDRKTAAN